MPTRRDAGIALPDEYFRLPDAWNGDPPAELPSAHRALIDGFPGDASPPDGDVLLAEIDGAVGAQVLVVRHDSTTARLERMYVIERARRQGAASLLIESALQGAQSLGYARVVLDVIAKRIIARGLFENRGFAPVDPYADYGRPMSYLGRTL